MTEATRATPRRLRARTALRTAGCALLLLGVPSWTLALDPSKAITQYMHDVWQTEDGLPSISVTAIAETPDGYLWLGTREGHVRFDGVRFTVFDTQTVPELGHNWVICLLADKAGRLWIGTSGGGVVRRESGRFTRLSTEHGLPSEQVSALLEDGQGRLWVGTDGGGLARAEGSRFVHEASLDALGTSVRALLEDEGSIWVATEGGLARLSDGKLTSFTTAQGLSRRSVRSLLRDRSGSVWIGTDDGLNRFEDGRFTVFTTQQGLSGNVIQALRQDREGNLWVGTDGGGLNRMSDGRFTAFTTKEGLANDTIYALHEDREGSLWIGTNLGGLNRLRDGRFTPFTVREGLSADFARAVYEDRAGSLWIATEGGGVNRLKDGLITSFTNKGAGLSNDTVFCLLEDRAGDLWIGTDNGLNRLRNGRLKVFTANMGLSNDSVLALHEDQEGSLWIGTYAEGLNRYKDGRFTTFTSKDGLSNDTVNTIYEDRAGTLWIGTRGGGLNRLVEPRLLETIWFRGLVVVFFALVGPLFHRFRILRLNRQKAELERLVAARTAEVEAANARLAQLAREDGLTGVANRRTLDATLDEEWRRANRLGTPLSLILLDVDSFKAYNDRHGHQAGDACLRTVAQAVADAHRRAGELVARYGGEELAVVLPGVTHDQALEQAENLRRRVLELAVPHPGSAVAAVVTVSAGVACSRPVPEGSPADLVAAADRALYLAKQRGRNRVESDLDLPALEPLP